MSLGRVTRIPFMLSLPPPHGSTSQWRLPSNAGREGSSRCRAGEWQCECRPSSYGRSIDLVRIGKDRGGLRVGGGEENPLAPPPPLFFGAGGEPPGYTE